MRATEGGKVLYDLDYFKNKPVQDWSKLDLELFFLHHKDNPEATDFIKNISKLGKYLFKDCKTTTIFNFKIPLFTRNIVINCSKTEFRPYSLRQTQNSFEIKLVHCALWTNLKIKEYIYNFDIKLSSSKIKDLKKYFEQREEEKQQFFKTKGLI